MKILIKQAVIADTNSYYNNQSLDILISDGILVKIAKEINEVADQTIQEENLMVSPGWVDAFSNFCDPGNEFKETLHTGAATAAAGGYTDVLILPNTSPVVDSKSLVQYLKLAKTPIQIHPLGAITKQIAGKDLAEMYDMFDSGAVAFTDGTQPIQSAGLLLKALQYVKAFDGVLIQMPIEKTIGMGGLINEGIVSTQLGLPGIPAIAEEMILKRDIDLLRYTQSRLHVTGVSTQKGMELIQSAKEEGLSITCGVTPYHLYFCDEDLITYDTNLKLNPPLRTQKDQDFLKKAVLSGWVDCIDAHHFPQDWDHKTCEFEYAKNGMIGLQTCFSVLNHCLPTLTNEQLVNLMSNNARKIFKLPNASIVEGNPCCMSLFSRKNSFTLTKENNQSKSSNSPFFNVDLNGRAIGIVHQQIYLNPKH